VCSVLATCFCNKFFICINSCYSCWTSNPYHCILAEQAQHFSHCSRTTNNKLPHFVYPLLQNSCVFDKMFCFIVKLAKVIFQKLSSLTNSFTRSIIDSSKRPSAIGKHTTRQNVFTIDQPLPSLIY